MRVKKLLSALIISAILLSAGVFGFITFGGEKETQPTFAQFSIWEPRDFQGDDGDGDGSEESPFLIKTAGMLNSSTMRTRMATANRNWHFVLIDDITLTGNWTPIPSLAAGNVFDGNNYTIDGLTVTAGSNRGFFGTVSGTVKNLTMENVAVGGTGTSTGSNVGAVAGAASGNALFSRIFIQSGFVRGSSAVGSIVGNVNSGATVKIEKCLNRANVFGGTVHIGGITGGIMNVAATLHVTEVANYGDVRGGTRYSGGVVGCVDLTSVLTVEWSYNRGRINASGGVVGEALTAGSTISIMNSYNDARFINNTGPRGGIAQIGQGTFQISNNWFNNAAPANAPANTLPTAAIVGTTNASLEHLHPGNGRLPGNTPFGSNTTMHSDDFVRLMNMEHMPNPIEKFVLHNGYTQLLSLIKTDTIVLYPNGGSGTPFVIHKLPGTDGTTVVTLPEYAREDVKATIGTRLGYRFAGWRLEDTLGDPLQPGDTVTLEDGVGMLVFDTVWEKLSYKIEFINGGALHDGGLVTDDIIHQFHIWSADDDNNFTIRAQDWGSGYAWMALRADAEEDDHFGWVSISRSATVNFYQLVDEASVDTPAFFQNFIDETYTVGGVAGKITIRLTDQTTAHVINVTSNETDAGRLGIKLHNVANPVLANFNDRVRGQSLPNSPGNWIENLQVVRTNNYYEFTSLEIYDTTFDPWSGDAPINPPILVIPAADLAAYKFLDNQLFNLGAGIGGTHIRSNWTIHLNFERVPFEFMFEAALLGGQALENYLIEHIEADTILIGEEDVSVSARANETVIIEGVTYQFSAWKMYRNPTYAAANELSPSFQLGTGQTLSKIVDEIDYYWLDEFLNQTTEQVRIVAEYVRMFSIVAFVQEDSQGFSHGTLEIYVDEWQPDDGMLLGTELIPEGSAISIRAIPNNNFYEVDSFGSAKVGDHLEFDTLSFEVTEDRAIIVSFKPSTFSVVFAPVNLRGSAIARQTSVPRVNDAFPGRLSLGETLSTVETPIVAGYQFAHFEIYTQDTSSGFYTRRTEITSENFGNIQVTEGFLLANLQGERFIITAEFSSNFSLRVEIPNNTAHMGNFEVFVDGKLEFRSTGQTNKTMRDYFDPGAKIEIVATTTNDRVFRLGGFTSSSATLPGTVTDGGKRFTFPLDRSGVTIRIDFDLVRYTINGTLGNAGGGESFAVFGGNELESEFTINNATLNNQIQLVAEADSNKEVKEWLINGVRVQELLRDMPTSITREGNTITITLTAEWFERFGDGQLDSSVTFGYTTMFLLLTVGLPCVILLLAAILAMHFLNLQKKKRLIKKYLLADKAARANFNQASIVSGAREGKDITGVSKAAIKAAMKAEKDKLKGKPQVIPKAVTAVASEVKAPVTPQPKPTTTPPPAPTPAPTPKPVQTPPAAPTQPAVPKLSGTKMLPDRTIVDSERNVVAVLRQDGTIVDRQGKEFATIRMSDGAIIDVNEKILGMVGGDGTIV